MKSLQEVIVDSVNAVSEKKNGNTTGNLLKSGKAGDVIVVHTSVNYTPSVTLVKKSEFESYFTGDNGWSDKDLEKVKSAKSGDVINSEDQIMGNEIHIVVL
jgi:hypothetical protein